MAVLAPPPPKAGFLTRLRSVAPSLCTSQGYKCIVITSPKCSKEKMDSIRAYGATLLVSGPGQDYMQMVRQPLTTWGTFRENLIFLKLISNHPPRNFVPLHHPPRAV